MIKQIVLSCFIAGVFLASGCDVFVLADQSAILEGRWSSNVVARSGDCCHIDLNLVPEEELVTGRGIVKTPGESLGEELQFAVEVSGQFIDDRLELRSLSQANPVIIQGVLDRNPAPGEDIVLRVNFEGFGKTGRDIILFQR